jgi:hypothetical protein
VNRGVHASFCNGLQLMIYCDLLTELLPWQAKHVGNLGGALTKNLLLKVCMLLELMDGQFLGARYTCIHASMSESCRFQDKKHRLYIVSALADTKVDMKSR